ncbi:hypothetical protein QJS10_CPB17g00225 [Acorus calamus]|uniref:Uncharacterized protein n=1 Tax=Acorus calamus TaxID=4465 RepID=A0AAV9CZP2_ACOCL|nr:hypothetical protein QJS10_CPB17g00225 [Acorus calamus]
MASRPSAISFSLAFHALLFVVVSSAADDPCVTGSAYAGFEADLAMVQHQLRGRIRILDGCSFQVRRFDMIEGSDAVRWWGSPGADLGNLTSGFALSDDRLNQTYSNETLSVRLYGNLTWDRIAVLSVWDDSTASDFGHAFIALPANDSSTGPSPSPGDKGPVFESQPTTFDNCKTLSPVFRLRWTLDPENGTIDVGLEAGIGIQQYMAFGWARPGYSQSQSPMLHSDVTVAGFTEEGEPFAEDYFITQYSECLSNKDGTVEGVCPDTIYDDSDPAGLVNNTRLIYGNRRDGVSFVRYQRPLESEDKKYDVVINKSERMAVVWAFGSLRPPDSLRPYYLPENHGGSIDSNFGHLVLNVSESVDDCTGPLVAEDKEDQDVIFADGKTPLVVTSGPAVHYPNPPNPAKVLYVNKKEAPLLKVERGVPVKFSIQAGHDVALYVTSDPIGGNATLRNALETLYAGGAEAEGVQASPTELIWQPDRNTPDRVYYHSLFTPKMGYKVDVVDGGLSDMYNNSVVLDDQQVTFFWTLSEDSISIAARGEKKSGYLAIGFGGGMVNSFAYVGWIDNDGIGRVSTYWIDGQDALSVHPTSENLTYVRCNSEKDIITFEFTRPLVLSCSGKVECKNIIDPTTPLRVIWAMGARWSANNLSDSNMHSVMSGRPLRVLLMRGSAEAEQDLRPVLAVHGFMMFVAWGILLPGGILSARYLKHLKGDGWYQIHVYLQYSGISIVLLGVLFAAAELRGFYIGSVHVKFGMTAILLACAQPINAYFRPKKHVNGVEVSSERVLWEYLHVITGRCAILVGIAALFSGMKHLGDRYGGENVNGLNWALIIWFLLAALLVVYLEYVESKRKRRDGSSVKGSWVLGNTEEDDSVDLLHPNGTYADGEPHASERMEVQLEPMSR